MTTIADPKAPRPPRAKPNRLTTRGNTELYGWVFMRASGVILLVLIFGHLFVNLVSGEGVRQIDFAFVAGKLANPFWIVWDMLLLWLALIHGANGMRTLINDYAHNRLRLVLLVLLAAVTITLLTLGTLVLTTFDPCPAGQPANLVADFCSTK